MTEIESLKQTLIEQIEQSEDMTEFDAYAYLQMLNTHAWRYITDHYDEDHRI